VSGFIDSVDVTFESGRGGDGSASFHREKFVPRGGPNGADGGKGGDVVLVADRNKRTLYDFKLDDHLRAQDGTKAMMNKRGKDGTDCMVLLPIGTIITDRETGEVIADLNHDGMKVVICEGGRGGQGNVHFTNSVRQAPTFAQKGGPTMTRVCHLELKLLADVALIGLPNAGKSTLLSRMSAAKPKIADYPFTTLSPNLGVVKVADRTFVMADLPGLIEGASEGIGLGHQFLKHAERNRILLHLVEAFPLDGSAPIDNFQTIEAELEQYSQELYALPRIVALTKCDLTYDESALDEVAATFGDLELFRISAVSGRGMEDLGRTLLDAIDKEIEERPVKLVPVLKPKLEERYEVSRDRDGRFRVKGRRVEQLVAMTDLTNLEAVMYLHRMLQRIGVVQQLRELGVDDGDEVVVGNFSFTYQD
jgi:GTP-binding protein